MKKSETDQLGILKKWVKLLQSKLEKMAYTLAVNRSDRYLLLHDYLTALPNRVSFEKHISCLIEKSKQQNTCFAVLYLGLNNFKAVNDTYGHDVGDIFLKKIARVLASNIHKKDMIARLGGDEFAIGFEIENPEDALTKAQKLLNQLSNPIVFHAEKIITSASIGIAIYPETGETSQALIKHADIAMYRAKQSGKNKPVCFYDMTRHIDHKKNSTILMGLNNINTSQELLLEYQPIYSLKQKEYHGLETLIRWHHPTLGLLLPDEFLPQARDMEMMRTIDTWSIAQAFQEYSVLQSQYQFLTFNVSMDELEKPWIIDLILENIQKQHLDAGAIVVELTETAMIQHPDVMIKKLKQLIDAGVKIAIDDYGTGYSSLSYLKNLPISMVKIDKQFIDDIANNRANMLIVESTIRLAHSLKLEVVAEGVETQEQLDILKQLNCDFVQGFYLSKPMRFEAFALTCQ